MLLKRATAGRLPLHQAISAESGDASSEELSALQGARKAFLSIAGAAAAKFGESLKNEQEVLMHLSDMVMEIYAMDTALRRAGKNNASEICGAIVRAFVNDAMHRLTFFASQILPAVAEGDALHTGLSAARRLLRWTPVNTVQLRQRIAEYLIDHGRYAF